MDLVVLGGVRNGVLGFVDVGCGWLVLVLSWLFVYFCHVFLCLLVGVVVLVVPSGGSGSLMCPEVSVLVVCPLWCLMGFCVFVLKLWAWFLLCGRRLVLVDDSHLCEVVPSSLVAACVSLVCERLL